MPGSPRWTTFWASSSSTSVLVCNQIGSAPRPFSAVVGFRIRWWAQNRRKESASSRGRTCHWPPSSHVSPSLPTTPSGRGPWETFKSKTEIQVRTHQDQNGMEHNKKELISRRKSLKNSNIGAKLSLKSAWKVPLSKEAYLLPVKWCLWIHFRISFPIFAIVRNAINHFKRKP